MKKTEIKKAIEVLEGHNDDRFIFSLVNHNTQEISQFKVSGYRVVLKLYEFLTWSDEKISQMDFQIDFED